VDRSSWDGALPDDQGHSDYEPLAQVFIAHLGDEPEPLFATARLERCLAEGARSFPQAKNS
jgi:hypothetical protein